MSKQTIPADDKFGQMKNSAITINELETTKNEVLRLLTKVLSAK
jgi:hypothetical protein